VLTEKIAYCHDDLHDIIHLVQDDNSWRFFFSKEKKVFRTDISDELRQIVDLIGALRNAQAIDILAEKLFQPSSLSRNPPRGYELYPCILALARHDSATLDSVLKKCKNGYDPFIVEGYFSKLLPKESFFAIVDEYLEMDKTHINSNQKEYLLEMKTYFSELLAEKNELPPLSKAVMNHPLYKKRQSAIDLNLLILKEQKNIIELNIKTFNAIQKLGELRSVEAVEVLTPYLLLQSKTEFIKPDEKYITLQKYPVAISLAQIGTPSIRGLLKEVAKGKDEPEYIETAYKTMSTILPSAAILGFVDEAIENEKDQEAKKRLEKLYPLLPQQEEIKKRLNEKHETEKKENTRN
jgi:hypothetical protein